MDLKQLRQRWQQQCQKTIGFMTKTTALKLYVHHAFQYISLTSTSPLRRKTSLCVTAGIKTKMAQNKVVRVVALNVKLPYTQSFRF